MQKQLKGGKNMTVVTLSSIQNEVKRNSEANKDKIADYIQEIETKGLRKGRVRPRSKEEEQILSRFKRR
ncbi:hypothetical protein [Shouchella shacheensis]|uniref:hypothetical protein n=1 Tax=Shouchella shacheensis TaxID=1649580 RepID=UPI00073FEC18|nr:hypothetical protein [Shouchella shacheensis]